MHPIKALQNIFAETLSHLDFKAYPIELYGPIKYTLSFGGKRLRPILLLAGCDLFGGDIQKALFPAVGIELFHNFTLLHDDIMDQAPLRRGKQTVHKKWNINIAILSGDTMFALAYQHLQKCDHELLPAVMDVITHTAIEVCEGQQLDMNFETQADVSIADYLEMIRQKTATLFAGSLKIGALIGDAGSMDADHLYRCGMNMGMAFQLQDDLLDIYSDESLFGKKPGGDIGANKKTYPYLKALEVAEGSDHHRLIHLYNGLMTDDTAKVARVKEIYARLKIKDLTLEAMESYYSCALKDLSTVSVDNDRKIVLESLIGEMMRRNF